jgi:hypothetical protein
VNTQVRFRPCFWASASDNCGEKIGPITSVPIVWLDALSSAGYRPGRRAKLWRCVLSPIIEIALREAKQNPNHQMTVVIPELVEKR